MPAFDIKSIRGVIPAMVTPFDENEALDEKRLRAVVNFLIERKVEGLYITGSTGESFLMSPQERKRVVEITVEEVKGRIPIIAHIGAIGTRISIDLAQHAEAAHLAPQVHGELIAAVYFGSAGGNFGLRKAAHGIAQGIDVFTQLKVKARHVHGVLLQIQLIGLRHRHQCLLHHCAH